MDNIWSNISNIGPRDEFRRELRLIKPFNSHSRIDGKGFALEVIAWAAVYRETAASTDADEK